MKSPGKLRKAKVGERHRLDRSFHPEALIAEAPNLTARELGTTTAAVQDLTANGPRALRKAMHAAAKLSAKFGEEFEAEWLLRTNWLIQEEHATPRGPGRVRYALIWRPRFLAVLALTRSTMIACRVSGVNFRTQRRHREADPDFEAQCVAAEAHAVALLHDSCFASALEGDCEPVYWQGIRVGHVRKFDSRLRIEMLRAYKPNRFKTPGSAALQVFAGQGSQVLVIGPEEQQQLIDARRASLLRLRAAHEADQQPLAPTLELPPAPQPGA